MKRKGKIIMICIIVTILGFNYALTGCQDFNGDYGTIYHCRIFCCK